MAPERHDYHVHSRYSDGGDMEAMVKTAVDIGLSGIGFADHCLFSHPQKEARVSYPMDLDRLEERRADIERLRNRHDIEIFEGMEIDYYPDDERNIERFIAENDFDYVIGSVHEVSKHSRHNPGPSVHHGPDEPGTEAELDAYVDRYFESLCRLIDSELFDIAAHLDLIERNDYLRGRPSRDEYERVAAALEQSRTMPEINGNRVDEDWPVLPRQPFFEVLRERDISFVRGSDAHSALSIETRNDRIDDVSTRFEVELQTIL